MDIPDECPAGGEHVLEEDERPYDVPGTFGGQTLRILHCDACGEEIAARLEP